MASSEGTDSDDDLIEEPQAFEFTNGEAFSRMFENSNIKVNELKEFFNMLKEM